MSVGETVTGGIPPSRIAASLSLVAACGLAQAKPVDYTILTKISRVAFNLEHQGFIQLFGTLRVTQGTLTFDSDDWNKSKIDVALPISSLDMGDGPSRPSGGRGRGRSPSRRRSPRPGEA